MNDYYLCVRGHVVQYSERAGNPRIAALACYGVVDLVTVLNIGQQLPTADEQRNLYTQLRLLHFKLTGNRLLPVEKLTMIPSPAVQKCFCGSGLPSWVEYSPYLKTPLCRVCEECYPSKEDWIYERRHK